MALRARRRQGGSSRGGGRPSEVISSGPGELNPVGPHKGQGNYNYGGSTLGSGGGAPARPAFSAYQRGAAPAASAPVRGATSEALRSNAGAQLGIAKNRNRDAVFRAIMQLGDPATIAKYRNDPRFAGMTFAEDPNSVWANLARQQKQGLENIDTHSNVGNTFFSGMRLRDRQDLTDASDRARLGASTSFGDEVSELDRVLGTEQSNYNQSMSDADQMDIEAALERDRLAREAWEAQERENERVHNEQQAAAQAQWEAQQQQAAQAYAAQNRQRAQFEAAQARARQQEREAQERARRRRRR